MSPPVPPSPRARIAAVAALTGVLALTGGCSLFRRDRAVLTCPRTAIIEPLASLDGYRDGAPRTEENVAYRAALQNIGGTCASAGQDITVNVSVEVTADAGPAFERRPIDLPYFLTVLGPDGAVLDRRDYAARVNIPEGSRRGATRESFQQRFVAIGKQRGDQYQVLFGLTLPPGEAERRAPGS